MQMMMNGGGPPEGMRFRTPQDMMGGGMLPSMQQFQGQGMG